jgi:hypothetical protein
MTENVLPSEPAQTVDRLEAAIVDLDSLQATESATPVPDDISPAVPGTPEPPD